MEPQCSSTLCLPSEVGTWMLSWHCEIFHKVSSKSQNISFFLAYHFRPLNKLQGLCIVLFVLGCLYLWVVCFLWSATRERLVNCIWFADIILSNIKEVSLTLLRSFRHNPTNSNPELCTLKVMVTLSHEGSSANCVVCDGGWKDYSELCKCHPCMGELGLYISCKVEPSICHMQNTNHISSLEMC